MGIILRGLFFLFMLDLGLLAWIGWNYGALAFLALLILPGFLGGPLVLRQIGQSFRKLQDEMSQGRTPSQSMAEGGALLLAGVLLLIPGPLSTCCGLLLLLPPIRKVAAFFWVRTLSKNLPAPGTAPGGPQGFGNVHVRVVSINPDGVSSTQGFAAPPRSSGGIKTVEAFDPDSPPQLEDHNPQNPPSSPSGS